MSMMKAPSTKAGRKCLKCVSVFSSSCPYNRICSPCSSKNASIRVAKRVTMTGEIGKIHAEARSRRRPGSR